MSNSGDFQPGTASSEPETLVEISVSCRNLIDADRFSKSDPMCVLFEEEPGTKAWKEFGRTEVVWNNLNPEFAKKFELNYYFEKIQKLKFEIYDIDSKSTDLSKHDFLGRTECTLGEIVSSGSKFTKQLDAKDANSGSIILTTEEVSSCKEKVFIQFRAEKLQKKDLLSKLDPFLVFYRSYPDGSFTLVHRTEVIKKTQNPTWQPAEIALRSLNNADFDRPIKVEVYDCSTDGKHDLIGEFTTNLRELSRGPGDKNTFECTHPKKKEKKGKVVLMSCKVEEAYSFLDYVKGGTQLHCTFAVDFTSSNGDPRSPDSLHYIDPHKPNPYANALRAVGDIIKDYDSDNLFPALGFGAKLPPDGAVSHEFPLNSNVSNPYCVGIDGVLDAYNKTLHNVQLYGPTNFSPSINHVARFASSKRDGNDYFILLIITDGCITDMQQTCEAIVNASRLPISIIIVGVGDADFGAMNALDGDDVRVSFQGKDAARDIVQFVPMRNFICGEDESPDVVQARLAKEVLEEIPEQFLSYMKTHNVRPRDPIDRSSSLLRR